MTLLHPIFHKNQLLNIDSSISSNEACNVMFNVALASYSSLFRDKIALSYSFVL